MLKTQNIKKKAKLSKAVEEAIKGEKVKIERKRRVLLRPDILKTWRTTALLPYSR